MEQRDELWLDGPCFYYDTALFPPGTDSFALAHFARPARGDTVCDLGSGTGLLGTLLLARENSLIIENVELSAPAAALARKSFLENGWEGRAVFHTGDLRNASTLPLPGSVDYVISTAPNGSRTFSAPCVQAAKRILRYGGRFALVHRAERLTDVLCTLRASGIEPKRLRFLAKSADSAPSLLLVEGKRGGKSGLILEPPLIPGSAEWDRVYFRK